MARLVLLEEATSFDWFKRLEAGTIKTNTIKLKYNLLMFVNFKNDSLQALIKLTIINW